MKVLVFSDTHGDLRSLAQIVETPADVYIAAGDLSTFRKGLDRCCEALKSLGEKLWVLPGNHESHDDTKAHCAKYGFVDFHRQIKKIGGTNWAGLGYSNITPFDTPGEYSEGEIAEAMLAFNDLPSLYLVCHCPPHATKLDEYAPGKHGGSTAIREWIEKHQPPHFYCGHIHETAGKTDCLGATVCVNVGKTGILVEV